MKKYRAIDVQMWGVFYIGMAWEIFRRLIACFETHNDAVAWAKKFKASHSNASVMVEELSCEVPEWDGVCPDQDEFE